MAWLLSGLGVMVSIGFIAAGAVMNWRYGLAIARSVDDQQLNAVVHLLIDLCKVMMPFFMWWAWRELRLVVAAGAALVTAAAITYSAIGIAGYVNLSWSMSSGTLVGKQDQVADWRAELLRAQQRIAVLGIARAPSVIERELERLRLDPRWTASGSCTQVTTSVSRTLCAEFTRLEAELARAEEAAKLETRMQELRAQINELAGVSGIAASAGGDPRADMVARVTGWQLSRVQTLLALLFVGIVEFMSTFGVFLSLNHGELARIWKARSERRERAPQPISEGEVRPRPAIAGRTLPPPTMPKPDATRVSPQPVEEIIRFIADATEPASGGIEIADLYAHYAAWCASAGIDALDNTAFEREFDALRSMPEVGERISRFGTRYIGIGISGAVTRRRARR